ncbi:hypothetical protein TKK_0009824 [Trichogramma kaykai]
MGLFGPKSKSNEENSSTGEGIMEIDVVLKYLDSCTSAERHAIIAKYISSSESDESEHPRDDRTDGVGKSIYTAPTDSNLVDLSNPHISSDMGPPIYETHTNTSNAQTTAHNAIPQGSASTSNAQTTTHNAIPQGSASTSAQNINFTPQNFDCSYFEQRQNTQGYPLANKQITQN